MVLTARIETGLKQRLAMTPQLRQAISLLMLSNRDLDALLRREVGGMPGLGLRSGGGSAADIAAQEDSLGAHLHAQIGMAFRDADARRIAEAFLAVLEPWGWLSTPVEAVARECGVSQTTAAEVLRQLQDLEPPGIFARSLAECLALQARDQGVLDGAMTTLLDHLDLVSTGDLDAVSARSGFPREDLATRLIWLRGFDPKPGLQFETPVPLSAPDLLVSGEEGDWRVSLNPTTLPDIVVLEVLDRDARRDAAQLQRAIARRNETVLTVARALVARQDAYLSGATAAAPITLRVLADAARCHPSTVSRITTALTAMTPRGTMTLKALMGRAVRGAGIGAEDLQARIADLIAQEDKRSPLNDAALVILLRAEGIAVARRTIAKYRKVAGLPSSPHRRRVGRN